MSKRDLLGGGPSKMDYQVLIQHVILALNFKHMKSMHLE